MGTNAAIPADAVTDRGVYDSLESLRAMLIAGEEIQAMAIQRRVFALTHRRQAVGATSGRVIVIQRNLFGGYTPLDFRWQDLRESEVKVGAFGATLILSAYRSNDLASNEGPPTHVVVQGLRKTEAQDVYRVCQTQAQAWREKRRIRELEEMRARAGGIQLGALGTPAPVTSPGGNGSDSSPTARLQRAKDMRESGLLTDAEFEQIKAKILSEL
jgi:Short C-terminal domain